MRSRWRGVAGLVLAATLAGCGDSEPSSPTAADLDDIDLSIDHTIVVADDGYDPSDLEVTAGEVVLLVNDGESEHSFTAADRSFDTGRMQPGEDVTLVLTEPGQVSFFDVADRDNEGTLTVRPGDG
jgi:plastocyanin